MSQELLVTVVDHQHDKRTASRPTGVAWRRPIGLVTAGVIGLAALSACGSPSPAQPSSPSPVSSAASAAGGGMNSTMPTPSGSSTAAAAQPSAAAAVITINKFAYSVPSSVRPGATVTVLNKDGEAHTVTADSGEAFDDKASPGASTSFTAPMKPGSYPFHCTYHSNMHGVLVVT
jgi:plastocyanin